MSLVVIISLGVGVEIGWYVLYVELYHWWVDLLTLDWSFIFDIDIDI